MGGHLADDMGIVADQRWGSAGQLSARRGSPDRASPRRVHPSTAGEPHVNPTGGSETEETPMAIQTTFTVSTGAHFAIGTKVNLDKGGDIIAASIKMKVILFAVFLSMFLPKTSFAFPVSAGIDYYLFLVSTPPAETVATLNSVETTPDGAETRIPVPQFVPILSGEPPLPTGDRARESVLGRIEYGVPIGGTRSYRTTFYPSPARTGS